MRAIIDSVRSNSQNDDIDSELIEYFGMYKTKIGLSEHQSNSKQLRININFYMVCVIGPLALFGIAGNALSVFVLRRDRGARAMSLLLQALSVGNALLLTIAFFGRMIPDVYCFTNSPLLETYFDYVYVFGMQYFSIGYDVVHMFIVYIILFIAVERNFAVLKPINRQTRGVFLVSRVRLYIAVVVLCSVAFHVPKLFEQRVRDFDANLTFPENQSASDELRFLSLSPSSDLNTAFYKAYRTLHVLVQHSIPILVITYANLLLAKLLRDARTINSNLRDAQTHSYSRGGYPKALISPIGRRGLFERGSIVALITVTCFLLGEVPMLVSNVLELCGFLTDSMRGDHIAFLFHGVAVRVLDLVSCSNLVLYCLCGSRFRRTLHRMLCGGGNDRIKTPTRSRTQT